MTSRVVQDAMSGTGSAMSFEHPVFFYRGEDEYLATLVPFIRAGAAAGEPVAVAVPSGNLRLLRGALGVPDPDTDTDTDRNRDPDPDPDPDPDRSVRFLDMALVGRNPGRILPKVLLAFADAHRSGRVRIIGEPVWPGRAPREYPACVQHEALINAAFHGRDVTLVCPYDADRLPAETLADARVTHPALIEDGRESVSDHFSPTRALARGNEPLTDEGGADAAAYDFDDRRLHGARRFAARIASRLGMAEEARATLSLIVAELTTNSVVHGGGRGTLRLWAEGDQLVCEVRDPGLLRDALAGRLPPPVDRPGGRGLLLVNDFATLVRMHTGPGGTTVRAHLDLRPRPLP
ncbi:anti-sigma factor RsbA family regulatory protein [Streptomyces sp. DSM 116496]|uniref:anti-sigma factor RsbA family regulatory protein n=1 Tax=Streptomyces stoeckheimensis TaxID=3344656 RepID=UPI0038B29F68